jgi:hypothetical protein
MFSTILLYKDSRRFLEERERCPGNQEMIARESSSMIAQQFHEIAMGVGALPCRGMAHPKLKLLRVMRLV